MSRKTQGLLLAATFLVIVLGSVIISAGDWSPAVHSVHGIQVQRMLDFTIAVTAAFFIAGHGVLIYFLIRYSLRPAGDQRRAGKRLALIWGLVPAIVMALVAEGGALIIGLPAWAAYYGDPPEDALTVEVTGQQFIWLVRYAGDDGQFGSKAPELSSVDNPLGLDEEDPASHDDIVLFNELAFVADRPVRVLLQSRDVLHSFFLREFRVKQDAVPGMTIQVWFKPTETGEYELGCNQICGLGHYRMRALVHSLGQQEFNDWMAEQPVFYGAW